MKDKTLLYPYPATYAHEHGELEQYRASYKANIACKGAIETAIADNYRDNRLGPEAVQQVLKQFDYERIFYVLANTVREKDWDDRISRDNKIWAKTIPVYENIDGFGDNRKAYSAYKQARAEMRELFNVKSNVEHLLDIHSGHKADRRQPETRQ